MNDLNQVQLTGIVTKDIRYMEKPKDEEEDEGIVKRMAVVLVACNYRAYDAGTGRPNDYVMYIDVNCFGPAADFAKAHIKKADPIFVCGKLRTSRWMAGGRSCQKIVIVAELLRLLTHAKIEKEETTG